MKLLTAIVLLLFALKDVSAQQRTVVKKKVPANMLVSGSTKLRPIQMQTALKNISAIMVKQPIEPTISDSLVSIEPFYQPRSPYHEGGCRVPGMTITVIETGFLRPEHPMSIFDFL